MIFQYIALVFASGQLLAQGQETSSSSIQQGWPGNDEVPSFEEEPNLHGVAKPPGTELPLGDDVKKECSSNTNACKNAFDDSTNVWTSENTQPQTITITLPQAQDVSGLMMYPGGSNTPGWIENHRVEVMVGSEWVIVANGRWLGDKSTKYAAFEPTPTRFIRLRALSVDNRATRMRIRRIRLYTSPSTPIEPGMGIWGPTVDLPLVAAAAAVNPRDNTVFLWSSAQVGAYGSEPQTNLVIWRPLTRTVSEPYLYTGQNMFCPGISIDADGQITVTGGNDGKGGDDRWNKGTTVLNPTNGVPRKTNMTTDRGYQASAMTSDNTIFTIGGSWKQGKGNNNRIERDGEVYSPTRNEWAALSKAKVLPMMTCDNEDFRENTDDRINYYRSDNHGWLFGWKDGTVFQAGPSKAMHWYGSRQTDRGVLKAGNRCDDGLGENCADRQNPARCDAMSGNAVMYDAIQGKIVTFGGSPDYEQSEATAAAHRITLGNAWGEVTVDLAGERGSLNHRRVYHSSVVLPDGTVFLTGGQTYAQPFSDDKAVLTPELYQPGNNTFLDMQPNNIVRVYHSFSLLLPDATVLNGGSGLGGNKYTTSHFDAQIYTPPYLLTDDLKPAVRPNIKLVGNFARNIDGHAILPVDHTLTFSADKEISSASLIRYGSATHTVNTDQRRIPLVLTPSGNNMYTTTVEQDLGKALPGYYMLFAMDAKGVPSHAETIQIKPGGSL